jgi:hypothetical protein
VWSVAGELEVHFSKCSMSYVGDIEPSLAGDIRVLGSASVREEIGFTVVGC